jgi:single-strand DNA-binding protein
LNKVQLIGKLGRDPELKYMPNSTAVVNFSLATSRKWKDKDGQKQEKTDWHRLSAFGKLAEIIGQWLKKGSLAYFEGRLQTREYEKDGQKHYVTEIIVSEMEMLGGGKREETERTGDVQDTPPEPSDASDLPF